MNFIKQDKNPDFASLNPFKDIKQAYYDGITEVYKPYGKNLYYYKANSLYSFVSLNYIPGKDCTYLEDLKGVSLNLNNLFGFFYCEIESKNGYLGLLPVHSDFGLIMPKGK
jgi:hypothetical protein